MEAREASHVARAKVPAHVAELRRRSVEQARAVIKAHAIRIAAGPKQAPFQLRGKHFLDVTEKNVWTSWNKISDGKSCFAVTQKKVP